MERYEKETLRDYGYAKIGTRCVDSFAWQAKGGTNVIGGVLGGILVGIGLFECNVNANVFHGWVVQCLLPAMPSNSVVVMDDAVFHKRQDIQEAITQAGHILAYLPPYSPDRNPIKKNGRKLKLFDDKKDVLSLCFLNRTFNNHFIGG